MADPYATPADVADLFGPLSEQQMERAEALIFYSSVMLRGRFPGLDQRIESGSLDPDQVKAATVNMALRVMRNPGGLKSETVGPFQRTWDTAGGGAGLLEITDFEVALLSGTEPRRAAGDIRLRPALGFPGGSRVCRR